MLVSLPNTTLNDAGSRTGASTGGRSKSIFAQTPSFKSLIDQVLLQPRALKAIKRLSATETVLKRDSAASVPSARASSSATTIKPEDEAVIQQVEQSQPTSDQTKIVKAIAGHLVSLVDNSSSLPAFEGKQIPSISIHDYVDRLIRYVDAWAGERPSVTSTGVSAALIAVEYLERIHTGISAKTIHRLYMCAVLVAVKFSEDFAISNRFWAKVGGIDLEEMNRLEVEFCNMLGWKLRVSREEFDSQQIRFAEPMF